MSENSLPESVEPETNSNTNTVTLEEEFAKDEEKETVYELPRTTIQKIVKSGIPEGISLSSESKNGFSKASVVFIMYLTAKANEIAEKRKKSTISADDVLLAVYSLIFIL